MNAGQRNPSISIKSLLSIISTSAWEPLDTQVTAKVTGTHKNGATAVFRRMLGINDPGYGSHYRTIIGEVLVDNIEGVRVARCYDVFVQRAKPIRGGHRFFWRIFPMSATDAEILASARKEVSSRAFMKNAAIRPEPRCVPVSLFVAPPAATVAPPVGATQASPALAPVTSIGNMTNDELIAKIKALWSDLEALEAERDARLQAAADLIERLKR
jgi:hypothetical protein